MNCIKIILIAAVLSTGLFGCRTKPKAENVPLLQFLAEENDQKAIDLSAAAVLEISIYHSEYPEPMQTITDASIIRQVTEILTNASVSPETDGTGSTQTATGIVLMDAQGSNICSVSIQNGMLEMQDGWHALTGIADLYNIEGILFEDDWKEYWEEYQMRNSDYQENMKASFPAPLLDMVSYTAQELHERSNISDIVSIRIRIEWSDMQAFETDDPEIIQSIFTALDQIEVLEYTENTSQEVKWTIVLGYRVPDETFNSTCSISFIGDALSSEVMNGNPYVFALSGLNNLLNSSDNEVFHYLKENLSSMDS